MFPCLLSALYCALYLHYVWTKPPLRQTYLLSHKEQRSPNTNTTAP